MENLLITVLGIIVVLMNCRMAEGNPIINRYYHLVPGYRRLEIGISVPCLIPSGICVFLMLLLAR